MNEGKKYTTNKLSRYVILFALLFIALLGIGKTASTENAFIGSTLLLLGGGLG